MHDTVMSYFGFVAELFPNSNRIIYKCRYIFRNIGFFISHLFIPPVFMLLSNIIARRIVVIFP